MLNELEVINLFKFNCLPIKDGEWWDGKPRDYSNLKQWYLDFSQKFGMNPDMYAQFGMKGHNGIDISFKTGCPVVSPGRLWVTFLQDNSDGYGNAVWTETETKKINGDYYKLEINFGHFSQNQAKAGRWLNAGDPIGIGGTTGFSTGPHTHIGVRPLWSKDGNTWQQMFPNNGYLGYINPEGLFPHLVWDERELIKDKTMDDYFKQVNDKKFVINKKTKTTGFYYQDKLIEVTDENAGKIACIYLARKEGNEITDAEWKAITKGNI